MPDALLTSTNSVKPVMAGVQASCIKSKPKKTVQLVNVQTARIQTATDRDTCTAEFKHIVDRAETL